MYEKSPIIQYENIPDLSFSPTGQANLEKSLRQIQGIRKIRLSSYIWNKMIDQSGGNEINKYSSDLKRAY